MVPLSPFQTCQISSFRLRPRLRLGFRFGFRLRLRVDLSITEPCHENLSRRLRLGLSVSVSLTLSLSLKPEIWQVCQSIEIEPIPEVNKNTTATRENSNHTLKLLTRIYKLIFIAEYMGHKADFKDYTGCFK